MERPAAAAAHGNLPLIKHLTPESRHCCLLSYGVMLPTGKWVAVVVILALQAYLILAPNLKTGGGA
jgi:hypothetical protein